MFESKKLVLLLLLTGCGFPEPLARSLPFLQLANETVEWIRLADEEYAKETGLMPGWSQTVQWKSAETEGHTREACWAHQPICSCAFPGLLIIGPETEHCVLCQMIVVEMGHEASLQAYGDGDPYYQRFGGNYYQAIRDRICH